jgi:hypothetical protein
MQYQVVSEMGCYQHVAVDKLKNTVRELILKGWIPQGGICVVCSSDHKIEYSAHQAMIRTD